MGAARRSSSSDDGAGLVMMGRKRPQEQPHPAAAWYINVFSTFTLTLLVFTGRLRDLLLALFWQQQQHHTGADGAGEAPAAAAAGDDDSGQQAASRTQQQQQKRTMNGGGGGGGGSREGYKEVTDPQASFYARRVYGRIHDCWNRPIASAPGAWVDVMERESIEGRTKATRNLALTGRRRRCLNLGSYNYLGFAAADEYCTPRVLDAIGSWGVSACASRTEGGATPLHAELERLVADFLGVEDAIAYGMGFATNSASLPVLCGPGTLVLSDALNHTSIVAGLKASGAAVKVFRHNDAAHLERLLRFHIAEGQPRTRRPWRKVVVVVEGIYSMEGEACPLAEIVALKKRYGAYLYLDEAHSIGAMGATGRGLCEHAGVDPRDVDVLMGTFTKSFGSAGGYVAGSRELIAYLRRHSPAHLYASSVAPGAAQQIVSALKLIRGDDGSGRGPAKVRRLHENANYFRRRLLDMGLHVLGDWDSPVMPIMVYHVGFLGAVSRMLLKRRVAMVVVGFPATPLLLCRCRVCISAAHTREDLDYALDAIGDAMRAARLDYAAAPGWASGWGLAAARGLAEAAGRWVMAAAVGCKGRDDDAAAAAAAGGTSGGLLNSIKGGRLPALSVSAGGAGGASPRSAACSCCCTGCCTGCSSCSSSCEASESGSGGDMSPAAAGPAGQAAQQRAPTEGGRLRSFPVVL